MRGARLQSLWTDRSVHMVVVFLYAGAGRGRFLWVRVWRRADVLGGGEVRGRADPVLVGGGEQAPCAGERTRVVLHVG